MDAQRHAEYYGMQQTFDELYAKSKAGEVFNGLMELVLSPDNIMLAYRNIKTKASWWNRQSASQNQPMGEHNRTKSACLTKWCWVSKTTTGLLPVSVWTAEKSTAES